ncbi:hypothetical protein ACFL1X_05930 [Candidatus Hydrogenedentota bacterium]
MRSFRLQSFTVVELVVVFIVIFLLSAIILPVAGHYKNVRDKAICASNLKTLGIVCMMYASEDLGGRYPPYTKWVEPTNTSLEGTQLVDMGKIYPRYIDEFSVLVCPRDGTNVEWSSAVDNRLKTNTNALTGTTGETDLRKIIGPTDVLSYSHSPFFCQDDWHFVETRYWMRDAGAIRKDGKVIGYDERYFDMDIDFNDPEFMATSTNIFSEVDGPYNTTVLYDTPWDGETGQMSVATEGEEDVLGKITRWAPVGSRVEDKRSHKIYRLIQLISDGYSNPGPSFYTLGVPRKAPISWDYNEYSLTTEDIVPQPNRHGSPGFNVLYADGHVEFKTWTEGDWHFNFPASDTNMVRKRWMGPKSDADKYGFPIDRPIWLPTPVKMVEEDEVE